MSLTVLVTGATAGFGDAIARRFVREGHRVIAAGRRVEKLTGLQAELGDALLPLTLDVTEAGDVAALPGSLPPAWRAVDVLVNNAGLALCRGWLSAGADWDRMIETNVVGLVHLTRALLPGMVERDRGHVVNLSSIAGSYAYPGGHVYGATKAFVSQFTANLKADLIGSNLPPDMGGAAAGGWTSYAPLSSDPAYNTTHYGQSAWAVGIFGNGLAAIAGAFNYLTTIVNMRCPGMTMFRLPLSVWAPFVLVGEGAAGK